MSPRDLLHAVLDDPSRAGELSPIEAAALAAGLAPLLAVLANRAGAVEAAAQKPERPERLLTAGEAAERLGVSPRWLRGRGRLPFARQLSPRVVRYSEQGLERWASTNASRLSRARATFARRKGADRDAT